MAAGSFTLEAELLGEPRDLRKSRRLGRREPAVGTLCGVTGRALAGEDVDPEDARVRPNSLTVETLKDFCKGHSCHESMAFSLASPCWISTSSFSRSAMISSGG